MIRMINSSFQMPIFYEIGFLLVILLILIAEFYALVLIFAHIDFIFTKGKEGFAKVVVTRGGQFQCFLIDSLKYCFIKGTWIVAEKRMVAEKDQYSPSCIAAFWEKIFAIMRLKGIHWIGTFNHISEVELMYEKYERNAKQEEVLREYSEKTKFIPLHIIPSVSMEFVNLDSKNPAGEADIPLNISLTLSFRLIDLYSLFFVLKEKEWYKFMKSIIFVYMRWYVGSKTLSELNKEGISRAVLDNKKVEELNINITGLTDLLRYYGIELDFLGLKNVDYADKEVTKSIQRKLQAKAEGEAALTKAEYKRQSREKEAEGEEYFLNKISQFGDYRRLEEIKEMGKMVEKGKKGDMFVFDTNKSSDNSVDVINTNRLNQLANKNKGEKKDDQNNK